MHAIQVYSDYQSLLNDFPRLPKYIIKILQTFTPGPIEFILPVFNQDVVVDRKLVTILNLADSFDKHEISDKSIRISYSNSAVLQSKDLTIFEVKENGSPIIFDDFSYEENLLPTLLDMSEIGVVKILRPGLITKSDIQNIVPQITVVKEYLSNQKIKNLEIFLTSSKPETTEKVLVLGTKESLKKEFNLWFLQHFTIIGRQNFMLLNLGSVVNCENVARQFGRNLHKAMDMGFSSIYLINQNWPNNQWGEILRFMIDNVSTRIVEPEKPKEVITLETILPLKPKFSR